jgi:acyl carrier protein
MNDVDLRPLVLETIGQIAPDADLDTLDPTADLRDEIDIDSMDFLNILVALHEKTGIEIPERDYAKVTTLDSLVAYLGQRSSA